MRFLWHVTRQRLIRRAGGFGPITISMERLAMDDDTTPEAAVPGLRLLRWLVTGLTATMIVGLLAIVAMLVIIVNRDSVRLPDEIALPAGVEARAVTFGARWIAVVTNDDRILIYDEDGDQLRQEVRSDTTP